MIWSDKFLGNAVKDKEGKTESQLLWTKILSIRLAEEALDQMNFLPVSGISTRAQVFIKFLKDHIAGVEWE